MQVSKHLIAVAAVVFLALFGTVFFLLGRESSRHHAPVTSEAAAPAAAGSPGAPAAGAPTASAPAASSSPPLAKAPIAAPPLPTTDPLPPVGTTLGAPAEAPGAAAVRDYFAKMQALQTVGPTADTGEFANRLLTASMGGDTSGFDELVRAAETGASRAKAITPPPACAAYHQKLIAMLGETVEMVKLLKTAISTHDQNALSSLAASGMSLQTRANALEDEARGIRQRFAIAN